MVILSIIFAIIIFSILVLFHELGHFLLAKANGIRVNEFSLGLGPTIFGFTKGETKYSLKLLPFGGACMMEGEDETSEDDRAFNKKSVWARMSVVAAGPIFNFIMAFVFAMILIAFAGYDKPVLGGVIEGYAAEAAGLQEGDLIVKMNNKNIHFYRDISAYSIFHVGEPIEVIYERDGERFTTNLTPIYNEEAGRYLYGFIGGIRVKANPLEVVKYGFYELGYWISTTLESLKMLVTGGVSVNELSGPVGIVGSIAEGTEQAQQQGGPLSAFLTILNWAILLSANLGVMNLLPIPALDGGRLVFLVIEAIRRKPMDPNKEGFVHMIGLLLLFALMFVVMANDIRKIFM